MHFFMDMLHCMHIFYSTTCNKLAFLSSGLAGLVKLRGGGGGGEQNEPKRREVPRGLGKCSRPQDRIVSRVS